VAARVSRHRTNSVTPAEAGTQTSFRETAIVVGPERAASKVALTIAWIPAFAGMTMLRGLPSPEQTLDIGKFQRDIGRAAVIALARIGRRLHLAQQGVHLFDR